MNTVDTHHKPVLTVLNGTPLTPPPIWMMRQAGRYLPEYRTLRAKAKTFLDFCLDPPLAAEATLQPVQRFDLDAAILFSDILVIPHALGQTVDFVEHEGPKLSPITDGDHITGLAPHHVIERLQPVFATLRMVTPNLPPKVALFGFCGAPWTVASYMIAGKSTPDQAPLRHLAYTNRPLLLSLIDLITEISIEYLCAQIESGADVVQIFESFSAAVPPELFAICSLNPIKRIVDAVKQRHPDTKTIPYIRGNPYYTLRFAEERIGDAIGIDWMTPLDFILPKMPRMASQGNLDPLTLLAGGQALDDAADRILTQTRTRPHIFNLGHGILPQTPISHVEQLITRVRRS
ncbi:MAG: uroporphyrinogen decarboxylase [Methylobacteriaceae bacterium]|nr:uroporphyrinogen decarboxylase [Methylobacteriaceae bacterium]